MTSYLLLGEGEALDLAWKIACEMGLDSARLRLKSADHYNFDLNSLFENYPPADTQVFVALDQRAVNYARHKLIAEVRLAGFRLINLISPTAIIDESVRLMGNVYIGPGCNLAGDCTLGIGSWLERQVTLDRSVRLGPCVTLLTCVELGREVNIGRGSTLSSGSFAADGTQVGRHCEWLLGGRLPNVIPDHSFFDALMPEGARILGNA